MPSAADLRHLVTLYNQGRIADALQAGERLLTGDPDDASLNNMLGVLLARMDRLEEALQRYEHALALRPRYAEAFNNRGNALVRLQRYDEAIRDYREALAVMPGYAAAHNGLGNALQAAGRPEEAAASLRRALQHHPDYPEAHNNLGSVLLESHRPADAEQSFATALRLQPGMARAWAGRARALNQLGQHQEALAGIDKAVALRPAEARWYIERGNVLSDLGRADDAAASYAKAAELDPELPEAFASLGNAQLDLGRVEAAAGSYRAALRLQPEYAEVHYNLAYAGRVEEAGDHARQLQALWDKPDLPDNDRCYLAFALGKACEDAGDFDRSFEYYEQGNRLRKASLGYDIEADRRQFDLIRRVYAEQRDALEKAAPGVASGDPRPVFIVGMPRSGTSLVEQILASHSQVHGAGELDTATRVLLPLLERFDPGDLQGVRAAYLADIRSRAPGAAVVTDKMPGNFRWIGFLLAALPEAKIVHVRRNPVATCWSMYKRLFSRNGFTNDLGDLGAYYALYADLMADWRKMLPGKVYDLDYEALTENQEGETRRLLEVCELSWEDACLDFHATERAVRTASGRQVRRKMYQGSSEAWRRYEAHLGPLLSTLGATQ